jgi:diguanylate cyclase (GGDEF)-like protein
MQRRARRPKTKDMPLRPRAQDPFGFRLFLGLALTVLVAGLAAHSVVARQVGAELQASAERDLLGAVQQFERTAAKGPDGGTAMRAFGRRLSADGRWERVSILDRRGRGVYGQRIVRAETGATIFQSLRAGGRDYMIVAEHDRSRPQAIQDAVRDGLVVLALPALLGSLALFWLLAGRGLQIRHRLALESARRDGLTGLGNRRAFEDEVKRAVSFAARESGDAALAVFDVDDFKYLNDRRGHARGDEILIAVARVLGSGRGHDRAFRTGGDEFALLMPMTSEYEAHCATARMRRKLAEMEIAVSCGISATRAGMRSATILREEAEAALKEGKSRRADEPVRFSEVSSKARVLTPEKIHAVRLLIADGALDVALQPIWDLDSGSLVGCEGLARPHADYGFTDPSEVFEIARQVGLVADLDRLCVSRMLQRAPQLPDGTRLFINVHPASLDDSDEAEWLLDSLRKAGVQPDRIVVEVAERAGARVGSLIRSLERLRALGVKVALDGIGAGSSGLEMLHQIPVDFVKVDRCVVGRAHEDPAARGVLAAVAAFARETGTYVIAEGIEDATVLRFVRAFGDQYPGAIRGGQGYCLGRPAATLQEALVGARPSTHGRATRPQPSPAGHSDRDRLPSV